MQHWKTSLVLHPPLTKVTLAYPTELTGFNPDVFWLMDHATRLIE